MNPIACSRASRAVLFLLAATSIWCLLAQFYGLCPMRQFAIFILLPATLALIAWAALDAMRGTGVIYRAVVIGSVGGLIAAVAYDVFRLPFVFARPLGIDAVVPAMSLFKVFPRFGAMLLGEAIEQPAYSLAAHLLGWAYHFSNGATFGIMYLALLGDPRRHWLWAVLFAVGLELAMLFTPYASVFSIHITLTFVVVTLTAHLVFGVCLGVTLRRLAESPFPRRSHSVVTSSA